MVEDTLRKIGMATLEERRLTKELENNGHDDCIERLDFTTQLQRYFDAYKEKGRNYSFARYCEDSHEKMCPKCEVVFDLIKKRKRVRRQLSSLRGAVTKYALSIVNDSHEQEGE